MPKKRGKKWVATGWDKRLGYMKHLGTYDTQREAKNAEADFYKESRSSARETCDTFAGRWVADYPRPRESTNEHNAERIKAFVRDFKGVPLDNVTRPEARAWAMNHRGHLGAVRAMYGDAVRDGLVQSNPFAGLRLPGSKGRKEIRALTEAELHELADLVYKMGLGEYAEHYHAMVLFAGYVGCRPGEMFAAEQTDINSNLFTIERSLSKSGTVGPTKNGKARTVNIPPPAMGAIEIPRVTDLLFESPAGKMWTTTNHRHYWQRLRLLANRPDLDFYELRHTCATLLMERGAAPWEVAQQLGHTDGGQLVAELYGHPRDEVARARMAALWEPNVEPLRGVGA